MTKGGTMKIRVKRDLCCGAQMCILTAPELFRINELGYNASDGEDVPSNQEDEAQAAANACPERAITIESDDAPR